MTIEGAIVDLQNLIDSEGIPFWAKPSLQKILETVEAERERYIEERKTGRWEFVSYGDGLGNYHCSECRAIASSYYVGNLVNRHWEYKLTKYCPKCGAKMGGAEE